MRIYFVLPFAFIGSCAVCAAAAELPVSYSREVRPILADRCFACHGSDAEYRKSSLRLDQRDAALTGGDSGTPAIVVGEPDQSELIRRIDADESEVMPPVESKKSLSVKEKSLLKRWISEGAKYESHWAFSAPVRPPVPTVENQSWPQNEIDRFVLSRLQQEHLRPSPEADRETLLRRLSLDLTGLPPTLEELDAFLSDRSTDAFQRQVERHLESPHYGERWGRFWLDGARYADSDGYEKDKPRFVWAYRDWVVSALNRDLPYDQFVIEQIAGDLLPGASQDQVVATGFLRNSMINEEGGVDPEQFRMEAMFDRMDAIGKSVLGLTIQCCQCHDHKYDPISQREYYQLFAFLNDTHEANVAVYTADSQIERARILTAISDIEADLQHHHPDWPEQMVEWEKRVAADQIDWTVVAPEEKTSGGQKHYVQKDKSILAQGYAPTLHETGFEVQTELESVRAIRLELLNDPNLPMGGPGRSIDGTCALTEFWVKAGPADGSSELQDVKLVFATADVNPPERELAPRFDDKKNQRRVTGPVAYAIDDKNETAWGIEIGPGRSNVPRKAVFVLENPLQFPGGMRLKISLVQRHGGWNSDDNQTNNLGRFRFSVSDATAAVVDPLPAAVRAILRKSADERTPAESALVFSYWRTTVHEFQASNDEIEALWSRHPLPTSQLALMGRGSNPRETRMLARGNFLNPTDTVAKAVPGILHPLQVESPTRLDFARWLVDEGSPTAARSIVNRVWQMYFGMGLASTSEDFGLQGEPPNHQELLDWLSVEFMEQGWSLKQLHRSIVTSATYRQSSMVTPGLLTRDPDNRLFARGARFRMEAEGVRDIALAVSGLLNRQVGGPPVYPPAPEFLFEPPASYGPKTWNVATGPQRYRRAMYTFRFRSVPYPALQTFDAPPGDVACVRRVRSNTPLQALTTLNEPIFLECATSLAAAALTGHDANDKDRLAFAFRRCTARLPDEEEMRTLLKLLQTQRERLARGEICADQLVLKGLAGVPHNLDINELAAWTVVGRVLLNLDETITRN